MAKKNISGLSITQHYMMMQPHEKTTSLLPFIERAPLRWKASCANSECSMHQLSPYIGKLKSSIAGELIDQYSKIGDWVVDPFAGAGTIPFEAIIRGRHAFCADISPYARILSKAKLAPPPSLASAFLMAEDVLNEASRLPQPDMETVPHWVRSFFHPRTLDECIRFAEICRRPGNEFLMACFLGILHHQRPGFLSFPSSHLVPYLREKKYPRLEFPSMYEYRELKPRLLAKIQRSYKRYLQPDPSLFDFRQCAVQKLNFPRQFDALITSPPYMNALDYGRDNRLRLWFIDAGLVEPVDNDVTKRRPAFIEAIRYVARHIEMGLRANGYCVMVVGEALRRGANSHPSDVVVEVLTKEAPSVRLQKIISDDIPDIRRTRRECTGVKTEHLLIFHRS